MLFGVFSAVVGATFIALGATVFPWSQALGDTGAGARLFTDAPSSVALAVLALAGVGALTAVGAWASRRRRIAWVAALSGLGVLGLCLATLARPVHMASGYWLALFGGVILVASAIAQASSRSAFGPRRPLLRVSWLWNGSIVRQELLAEPRHVEIGTEARGGVPVPGIVRERLFEADGRTGDYDLLVTGGLSGTVSVGGARRTLGAPGGATEERVRLGPDDWGKLDFGDLSVVFQFMAPTAPVSVLAWLRVDAWAPTAVVVSLAAMLGFAAYLCAAYEPEQEMRTLASDQKRQILVDAEALSALPTPPIEEVEKPVPIDEPALGEKARGEEGKIGEPKALDLEPKRKPRADPRPITQAPRPVTTIVDLLRNDRESMRPFIDIVRGDTIQLDSRITVAIAGSDGVYVPGNGTNGMGIQGGHTGGGGEGDPTGLHSLGDMDGVPGGTRVAVGLRPKALVKARGTMSTQQGQSAGFCAKDNIASVVRSRASAIRACYESRLQVSPTLAGKLTARWTIGIEGRVTQAALATSSVPDNVVGQCVLGVVRRLAFQKPSGGVCVVQWPFVFSPG